MALPQNQQYEDGFKLGFLFGDKPYLNNHLDISVLYHPVIRYEEAAAVLWINLCIHLVITVGMCWMV